MSQDRTEKKLDILEAKLDDTNDHLHKIDITLTAQHISLKEHVKRTNDLQTIVLHVNRHVTMVEGVFKFLGISAALATVVVSVFQLGRWWFGL